MAEDVLQNISGLPRQRQDHTLKLAFLKNETRLCRVSPESFIHDA